MSSIEPDELRRALTVAANCLLVEIRNVDPGLAAKVETVLLPGGSNR